jgi:hypothetical protein
MALMLALILIVVILVLLVLVGVWKGLLFIIVGAIIFAFVFWLLKKFTDRATR